MESENIDNVRQYKNQAIEQSKRVELNSLIEEVNKESCMSTAARKQEVVKIPVIDDICTDSCLNVIPSFQDMDLKNTSVLSDHIGNITLDIPSDIEQAHFFVCNTYYQKWFEYRKI